MDNTYIFKNKNYKRILNFRVSILEKPLLVEYFFQMRIHQVNTYHNVKGNAFAIRTNNKLPFKMYILPLQNEVIQKYYNFINTLLISNDF